MLGNQKESGIAAPHTLFFLSNLGLLYMMKMEMLNWIERNSVTLWSEWYVDDLWQLLLLFLCLAHAVRNFLCSKITGFGAKCND